MTFVTRGLPFDMAEFQAQYGNRGDFDMRRSLYPVVEINIAIARKLLVEGVPFYVGTDSEPKYAEIKALHRIKNPEELLNKLLQEVARIYGYAEYAKFYGAMPIDDTDYCIYRGELYEFPVDMGEFNEAEDCSRHALVSTVSRPISAPSIRTGVGIIDAILAGLFTISVFGIATQKNLS